MVAMQIFRRLFQGNQPGRREHAHLAHASAEQFARDVRTLYELA